MKLYRYLSILLTILTPTFFACDEVAMNSENYVKSLSNKKIDRALNTVANMRIFFGHQSVGKNILAGINAISSDLNYKINIVESRAASENSREALFLHAGVGKNKNPLSKINDFREIVKNGIGANVDVAFFKFCYVDFNQSTDIQSIFQRYKETMNSLKKNYPQTTFIHFTVPLVEARVGIKGYIKKILGKRIINQEENIIRNQFNDMLRIEYEGKEPIFDLAQIESTFPDGKSETFEKDGSSFYALVPDYTDDGGHLNANGRKIVASKLLLFLASIY